MSHGSPDDGVMDTLSLAITVSDPEVARRLRILAAIEKRYHGVSFNDSDVPDAMVLKIVVPKGSAFHGELLADMAPFAEDIGSMTAEERAGRAAGELGQVIIDIETNVSYAHQHRTARALAERTRQAHAILGASPPLLPEAQHVARAFLWMTDPGILPMPVEKETYMAAAFRCVSWKDVAEAVASL